MALYRVKQFIWGITSLFKPINYTYINKFLTEEEIKLFNKLKINDKHHCIRVCKDCIEMKNNLNIDIDEYKLGRAALLHDIGKSKRYLSLIEKSIVVLLNKATNGKIKKYSNIPQINIYYNHPEIGVKILMENGFDINDELLQVVKYHHCENIININDEINVLLNIIKVCDDKN